MGLPNGGRAPPPPVYSTHPPVRSFPEVVVSNPEPRIHIIGVGPDGLSGLTTRARELLTAADVVFGSEQVLTLVPELRAERRVLGGDLQEAVAALTAVLGRNRVAI